MYESIVDSIYQLVSETTFSVTMVPRDYHGIINTADEFFSIQIIMPNSELFYNAKSIKGMVYVDIFTKIGSGDQRAAALMDELDSVFQGKTLENGLQFFNSSTQDQGKDQDNPSLKRVEYRIPFALYGEL